MSSLLVWFIGLFFIAAIGITDANKNFRIRKILSYENQICQPGKSHLHVDECADCICRDHGYGSICEIDICRRDRLRPIELRECEPYGEFTTACHFCKCSATGIPIGCIEKNRRCMDDILEDLDEERHREEKESMESYEDYNVRL